MKANKLTLAASNFNGVELKGDMTTLLKFKWAAAYTNGRPVADTYLSTVQRMGETDAGEAVEKFAKTDCAGVLRELKAAAAHNKANTLARSTIAHLAATATERELTDAAAADYKLAKAAACAAFTAFKSACESIAAAVDGLAICDKPKAGDAYRFMIHAAAKLGFPSPVAINENGGLELDSVGAQAALAANLEELPAGVPDMVHAAVIKLCAYDTELATERKAARELSKAKKRENESCLWWWFTGRELSRKLKAAAELYRKAEHAAASEKTAAAKDAAKTAKAAMEAAQAAVDAFREIEAAE